MIVRPEIRLEIRILDAAAEETVPFGLSGCGIDPGWLIRPAVGPRRGVGGRGRLFVDSVLGGEPPHRLQPVEFVGTGRRALHARPRSAGRDHAPDQRIGNRVAVQIDRNLHRDHGQHVADVEVLRAGRPFAAHLPGAPGQAGIVHRDPDTVAVGHDLLLIGPIAPQGRILEEVRNGLPLPERRNTRQKQHEKANSRAKRSPFVFVLGLVHPQCHR